MAKERGLEAAGGIRRLLVAAGAVTALWAIAPSSAVAADPYCDGDGTSGKRVQSVYAHVAGQPVDPNAVSLITQWSGEIDNVFNISAHRSQVGSSAHPRWLFAGPCPSTFSVNQIDIADPGGNFDTLRATLVAAGLTNLDRKYIVWMDSADCPGPVADFVPDTDPNPNTNLSNQNPGTGLQRPMYAVLCHGSWDDPPQPGVLFNTGPQHELVHTLGGVNRAAPNSKGGHCWDFWDALCADDDGVFDGMVTDLDYPFTTHCVPNSCPAVCANTPGFEGYTSQLLLDCGHNDYFSMDPAPGSYLASCWNIAKSNFLVTSGVTPTTPVAGACALPTPPAQPGAGADPGGFDLAAALKKCKKKKTKKARKKCKRRARQQAAASSAIR